jgi:putative redox protein
MSGLMPAVRVTSEGGDRLRIRVRGHSMQADQPVADGGGDTGPTPTEIFVAGLAACIAYYAERFLRRSGLPTDGLDVACAYRWAEGPHRVGEIDVTVTAPGLSEERRDAFARVIDHCTVHNTLRQPPAISVAVAPADSRRPAAEITRAR